MAYKTATLEKQSLEAITKHNLVFIEEVVAYLPVSKSTFYDHSLHESDAIKAAIEKNRISQKNKMRAKWYNSDNATLQVAAYKLLGTDEEADRLNGSKIKTEISGKDGGPVENSLTVKIIDGTRNK